MWSIHKHDSKLDRPGRAKSGSFWYITQAELSEYVKLEFVHNNFVQASGKIWRRVDAIPMGGSFSAQAADLYSIWRLKKAVTCMKLLGDLHWASNDYPYWVVNTSGGRVSLALAQFRDNIVVATTEAPGTSVVMSRVCHCLSKAWNLQVLCDCLADQNPCVGACMQGYCKALGLGLVRSASGEGLVFACPASLDRSWSLKAGFPLQHPKFASPHYLSTTFMSALIGTLPFLSSWTSLLLSISAWAQLAILCKFPPSFTIKCLKKAIWRCDHHSSASATIQWSQFLVRQLPLSCAEIVRLLSSWLRAHATWDSDRCCSWHLAHDPSIPHSPMCGDWTQDLPCLNTLIAAYDKVMQGTCGVPVAPGHHDFPDI